MLDSFNKQPALALNAQVVLADASTLTILSIKRFLPNRRIVCLANWNHQPVFAKLFFGKHCKRYATRDRSGVEALSEAAIKVPAFIRQLDIKNSAFSTEAGVALIYEAIEPAVNAEELWRTLSPDLRLALMLQLVETVAQHHSTGLIQTDLYLKNFLLQHQTIYTLDGDGVRSLRAFINKTQQLDNIATLFSKMDVLEDGWINELYHRYCTARGWQFDVNDYEEVLRLTRSIRRQVSTHYADKKVFRACTDVSVFQSKSQHGAYSNAFFEFVEPLRISLLDDMLNSNQILKMGNTCTVGLSQFHGQSVVIKRYNIKGFWHRVGRAIRQSRARLSWANAHRLQLLGISTPKPVALIEARNFGFVSGKAYFLSEFVDAPDVATFFATTQDKAQRAEAMKQIVLLFYRLHLLRISHGDMKANNIKMPSTVPVLIDLDSMIQHHLAFWANRAHLIDIKRFMQNWKDDASLYNAFVDTFKAIYPEPFLLIKAGMFDNKEIKD